MKQKGFTIWELLGVIVIILVVAVFLFPMFAIHHNKDKSTYCLSNMKQLGLGLWQYAQDNDQNMPNIMQDHSASQTWRNAIDGYVKSKGVYQCPSRDNKSDGPDGLPRSYAANYSGDYSGSKQDRGDGAFAGAGAKPISLLDLSEPSSLIALCEVTDHSGPDFNIDNLSVYNPDNPFLWAGHEGRGSFLFCDGHVRLRQPIDTRTEWHRDSNIPLSPQAVAMLVKAQRRAGG